MKIWQKILLGVTVIVTVAGLVTGLGVARGLDTERSCRQLDIIVSDSAERQIVSRGELVRLMKTNDCYPVGKRLRNISTDRIEDLVTDHPMVRTAECYPTSEDHIVVVLHQRVPLLKVVTEAGTYYIDTDREPMPVRESVTEEVLRVGGHVGERMAREELADFAEWLQDNRYWNRRIRAVRVVDQKHIYLVQQQGEPVILIGEMQGYERRLRKLRTFMEKGWPGLPDKPQYKELDIRFKDQVIGR